MQLNGTGEKRNGIKIKWNNAERKNKRCCELISN